MKINISDDIMQNKSIIKVIDGIAGSAKSSAIDDYFKGKYKRFTSTVKLMKDAIARFDCPCNTIAGGLFTSEKGKFFLEEREVDYETVVIDEVLQTSQRVLEWCNNHCGDYNIIICTDSRQLLPPEVGTYFLRRFKEFCEQDNVCYIRLTKTYRARDIQTEELFNLLYEHVENDEINMFEYLRDEFKTISYKDMPFNINSVYLTHTNDIEEFLYRDKDIINNTDLEFIAKGCIAKRKKVNYDNYPILCQNQAIKRKVTNYLQASNIGTVTRYQGSEVHDTQKCYFLIEKNSKICNREFYTALTRCWKKESFIIVMCDEVKEEKMTSFRGLPIKKKGFIHIKKDNIPANAINEKDKTVDIKVFNEIIDKHKNSPNMCFSEDIIYIDGNPYTKEQMKFNKEETKTKYTMLGLLKKEPMFDYSFMERVYKILDKNNIDWLKAPHFCGNVHSKKEFNRQMDLFSAYPHVLKYEYMPVNGKIYEKETVGTIPFYHYNGPLFGDCIITKPLKDRLEKILDKGTYEIDYLFSTDCKKGNYIGDTLIEACYKSVEEKKETKGVHWGYLEKKYLEKHNNCYVRNEYFNHQILMVHILSVLYEIILGIAFYLNGEDLGRICVDAVYYNEDENKTERLKDLFERELKEYDYRIIDKEENLLYQSYENLKTNKEIKAEKMRNYRKDKKKEQK